MDLDTYVPFMLKRVFDGMPVGVGWDHCPVRRRSFYHASLAFESLRGVQVASATGHRFRFAFLFPTECCIR